LFTETRKGRKNVDEAGLLGDFRVEKRSARRGVSVLKERGGKRYSPSG